MTHTTPSPAVVGSCSATRVASSVRTSRTRWSTGSCSWRHESDKTRAWPSALEEAEGTGTETRWIQMRDLPKRRAVAGPSHRATEGRRSRRPRQRRDPLRSPPRSGPPEAAPPDRGRRKTNRCQGGQQRFNNETRPRASSPISLPVSLSKFSPLQHRCVGRSRRRPGGGYLLGSAVTVRDAQEMEPAMVRVARRSALHAVADLRKTCGVRCKPPRRHA
jgi:hypothetical protein